MPDLMHLMPDPIRLLIVEDRKSDVRLILHAMRQGDLRFEHVLVETEDEFLNSLDPEPHVILADFNMPRFGALRALELLGQLQIDVPLIVISGSIGEETAVSTLQAGAADYLMKDRLQRVNDSIRRVIRDRLLRVEKRRIEHEHQRIFSEAPTLQAVCGFDGWLKRLNPAFEHQLGYPVAELLQIPYLELIHPADLESTRAEIARLRRGEVTVTFENRIRSRAGDWHWILWSAIPFVEEQRFFVTGQNITVRKREEQAARVRGGVLRILSETAKLRDAATACLEFIAEHLEAAAGEFWLQDARDNSLRLEAVWHLDPEKSELLRDSMGASLAAAESAAFNRSSVLLRREAVDWQRLDGNSTFPHAEQAGEHGLASAAGFPVVADGEVVAVFTFYRESTEQPGPDISELMMLIGNDVGQLILRRRVEDRLWLLNRAMSAIAEGVLVTDALLPDNPIIYCNPGFCRMTGYSEDQVLGRNCRFLQGPETDQQVRAEIRQAVDAGRPVSTEILNFRENGDPFWNRLSISPVRDRRGSVTHFVGVQSDVTERKQLEEQYAQSQKMESIGRLAGGIAHDFNNLLTIILGTAEVMLDGFDERSLEAEQLQDILAAGKRASALTGQLLAFSRRQILEPVALHLNTAIIELERLCGRIIGEDIVTKLHLDPDLPPVLVDPAQFEQVLLNLLVNARDAMPDGGTITIETLHVTLNGTNEKQPSDLSPGGYVRLTVRDTGCGMDREVQRRIFEPFFTTKDRDRGTGMGLPTVYGIVTQSGGDISVSSQPGRGTEFTVLLPCTDRQTDASYSPADEADTLTGSECILLVEDDPQVGRVAQQMLQEGGYQVLLAGGAAEALRLIQDSREPVHLLVTDVIMPEMGGDQLAIELSRQRPELRVLFMSGYTDDALAYRGVLDPGIHLIQKPFSRVRFLQKVRQVLDE